MTDFVNVQFQPTKGRHFCHSQIRSQDERSNAKMDYTAIKEAISPRTLNKFTFALLVFWIVVGTILCGAFS